MKPLEHMKLIADALEHFYVHSSAVDSTVVLDGSISLKKAVQLIEVLETALARSQNSIAALEAAKLEAQPAQQQANALEIAAQRFEGTLPFNWCAADGYSNGFDIAYELRLMAEENKEAQSVGVPAGWKLVPIEPTPEMLGAVLPAFNRVNALHEAMGHKREPLTDAQIYRAMVVAAPALPVEPPDPWDMPDAQEVFAYINKTPVVQSLLYDLNLLPECINDWTHWNYMLSVCEHFLSLNSSPAAPAVELPAWLDSQEFYELMQAYRWADMHHGTPQSTVDAFEAVKSAIRSKL